MLTELVETKESTKGKNKYEDGKLEVSKSGLVFQTGAVNLRWFEPKIPVLGRIR